MLMTKERVHIRPSSEFLESECAQIFSISSRVEEDGMGGEGCRWGGGGDGGGVCGGDDVVYILKKPNLKSNDL